jgi:two-component system phosphate regulon sensor histidine kinase PhoR
MKRLWNNSLAAKFFLSYLVVVALLFAGFYYSSSTILRNFYLESLGERMEQEATLLGRLLPFGLDGPAFDELCRHIARELGSRITVIAPDGRVLGDSAEISANMEDHSQRPEVIEALRRSPGKAVRFSQSAGQEMLFRAFRQTGPGEERIIRIATPLQKVESGLVSFRAALLLGLLLASVAGLALAWAVSRYLSRRFQRLVDFSGQVAAGRFPQNFFPSRERDEIARLERHLNDMSLRIRDNLAQITGEKDKADSILRCMIEGVLVLDTKGQVLVINDQAKAMFRVADDTDLKGVSMLEVSRHPEVHTILEEVVAFDFAGQRYTKEVELDDDRWFRVNAVRMSDNQGVAIGSILVFHDVTDIKRFESMRSDFVANVSHELRTPLTAIRGYVETLLHTPPSDPKDERQFLTIIDRHSERLSRLTEDLLILSDLESGKIQLTFQPLDVAQLIPRVFEVFWDQAAKKKVKLTQKVEPGLPPLLGDLDRLQQLFINLVDNAIKYTPAGGQVTLTASLAADTNTAPSLEISVTDTGPGIPEKDLPRLTERFYRVDKARSRDLGGTGLGLAIVKHIVQAHKGELRIDSVINQGTTVRVRLPAAAPKDKDPKVILFLSAGTSSLSRMAEGFARPLANGTQVYSASTEPGEVNPVAVHVMQEAGVDITQAKFKRLEEFSLDQVDLLVTLSGEDALISPPIPTTVKRIAWPLADPGPALGDDERVLCAFREVRDDLRARVLALFTKSRE